MGREQIILATSGGALRNAGNPDRRDRPASLSPDSCSSALALPGRCSIQVGFDRHVRQRLCPRIAGFGTPTLCRRLLGVQEPDGHVHSERRSGPCHHWRRNDPPQAVLTDSVPGEVAALIAATSAAPKRTSRNLKLRRFGFTVFSVNQFTRRLID